MIPPFDPGELSATAQKILAPDAHPRMRLAAARGVVPGLRPDHIVSVVAMLARSKDAEVASQAQVTLGTLPEPVLRGALGADLQPIVADALARAYLGEADIVERLVRMPRLADDTLGLLAESGDEAVTELVAVNQERLLKCPHLIELLYMNRATRMSTSDRIIELAVRNGVELRGLPAFREVAQAIGEELVPEPDPTGAPLPDDLFFMETDALARELDADHDTLEDFFVEDGEGQEHLNDRFVPLFKRLADMSVSQKVRRAMLGTKEERLLLVREANKVVARAAAASPLLQEPEVVLISRNRGVSEEVLRIIGTSPEWLKSYQVKRNLVQNAKTPVSISARLIPMLREADLRKLARDKNVSSAVQLAARRHLERRET
jgi:hypothetical protein